MNEEELAVELSLFLIKLREKGNLTQAGVAARSDAFGIKGILDQRTISRIEKSPLKVDAFKIGAYMKAVGSEPGVYFDYLHQLNYQKDTIMVGKNVDSVIDELIREAKIKMKNALDLLHSEQDSYLVPLELGDKLNRAKALLSGLARKPTIGFFGSYDAGKSTLINTIIDSCLLPAHYSPATSILYLVVHENDRPDTLKGEVALFRKGFKPFMLAHPELLEAYLIEEGQKSILELKGVHLDKVDISNEAYIAVIFSDAPILERVWLLDTPGNLYDVDAGDSDRDKALSGVELVDGVILLSIATGFLDKEQLYFASQIIRQLPPVNKSHSVEHLLFVLSHCHERISDKDVAKIAQATFKGRNNQLNEHIFNSWKEEKYIDITPTAESLIERMLPFWQENENYRSHMLMRIDEMAGFLVDNQKDIISVNIEQIYKRLSQEFDNALLTLESNKRCVVERVNEVEALNAQFRESSHGLMSKLETITRYCNHRKDDDLEQLRVFLTAKKSIDELTAIITQNYTSSGQAQGQIGNHIGQLLSSKVESVLKTSGQAFSHELDEALADWHSAVPDINKLRNMNASECNITGFDSRLAFLSGMVTGTNLGAIAIYISKISKEEGVQILVGQAGDFMAELRTFSGFTGVTSFVAAIGGPVSIGFAAATAIGYMLYRAAAGSWQRILAKKVHNMIIEKEVWKTIEQPVNAFWQSTEEAMKQGSQTLCTATDKYIEQLIEEANKTFDIVRIDVCSKHTTEVKKHLS
jgi:hypothetical protein